MGRDIATDLLPHYREVLVATAVRAIHECRPAVQAFLDGGERSSWQASASKGGWRAFAVAAGAVPADAILP
jgi:hypothetical protein